MQRVREDVDMGDRYDEQLSAARYRAERDQARQELARLRGEATTMSAYDLLPDEDREALRWVRKKGGLDAVRQRWERLSCYADTVPRSCMEKRLARLQRQVDESHAALRRRNQRIALLESEINRAHNENRVEFLRRAGNYTAFADEVCKRLAPQLRYVEGCTKDVMDAALEALDSRLMPKGMEWLLEVWPRWSNGEYCKFGDWWRSDKYGVHKPKKLRKLSIYTPEQLDEWGQGDGESYGYGWDFTRPSDPKHRPDKVEPPAPVALAADGEPLEARQKVWVVENGNRFYVVRLCDDGLVQGMLNGDLMKYLKPEQLTHTKPEIDSWERIEEDLGDEMAKQQCGPISPELACKLAGEFVRRCRALSERGE